MSNHPRRRPGLNGSRRPSTAVPTSGAPPAVCMTYAMAGPDDIEEAKQATHDRLVEQLGDRRQGGVYWRIIPPHEVPGVLRQLSDDEAQAHYEGETSRDDAFANMRRHLLEHPDAHLVIAQAAAVIE